MLRIYISCGVVHEVLGDMDKATNLPKRLQEGKDYIVVYYEERMQRCKVCDRTYPACEMVIRNGEQLCKQCDDERYPIKPEDIPF